MAWRATFPIAPKYLSNYKGARMIPPSGRQQIYTSITFFQFDPTAPLRQCAEVINPAECLA